MRPACSLLGSLPLLFSERTARYPLTMSPVYATATHIPTGEVTRTLGPFDTRHAARVTVGEVVGQVLTWERLATGACLAEKYPTLWVVEEREGVPAP